MKKLLSLFGLFLFSTAIASAQLPGMQIYPLLNTSISGPAATVSNTDNAVDAGVASTYTYTSKAIGTAATGRRIIVAVSSSGNGTSGRTISSVTIGGNAASTVASSFVQGTGGGQYAYIGFYILQVDAGTTATIVVTWSGLMSNSAIGVFAAYDLTSSTPTSTPVTSTANPLTNSINVSAGGILIGAAAVYYSLGVPTFTWANLTERYDTGISATSAHSGASDAFASTQTGLAVTATPSNFTAGAFTMAPFR